MHLQILKEIGGDEAGARHLETHLDIRQATLSQHLMALREAGVLDTRRDDCFIYIHILDRQLLEIIDNIAALAGVAMQASNQTQQACGCPRCEKLDQIARMATEEAGIETVVIKVKKMDEIMQYDILEKVRTSDQ